MLADRIREFVNATYLIPARERGEKRVSIRAGDVHKDMSLKAQMPAVCGALGSDTFQRQYSVRRISVEGPLHGANCIMTFEIE